MTAKFICTFEIKTPPEWELPGPPAWGLSATVWRSGLWPWKPAPLGHRDSSWGVRQHVSENRSLSRINLIYLPSLWLCAWMETSSLSNVSKKTKWGLQWKGLRATPEKQAGHRNLARQKPFMGKALDGHLLLPDHSHLCVIKGAKNTQKFFNVKQ